MGSLSRRRALAALGAALTAGCVRAPSSAEDDALPAWNTSRRSAAGSPYELETVIEGLEIPWDLSFAPNGDLFVSERPGRILRYDAGTVDAVAEPRDIVDAGAIDTDEEGGWWAAGGEGGLMGVTVHPAYPAVPRVYASYTYETVDGPRNKLAYYDVSADEPSLTVTTVLDGIPGHRVHNGSRITVGPDGYLWMTTGDANDRSRARDPDDLAGKVLRLEPDGSAPPDNPDLGGDPRVFTTGHRNPQGITFLPDSTPIVAEHGPGGHDEINVLRPGADYGWGDAREPSDYRGSDYARPVVNTGSDTWAPPGCVFYTGDAVPSLRDTLLVGGLNSQRLNVVSIYPAGEIPVGADGRRFEADWMDPEYDAVGHALFEDELGRIRHVEQGPDGAPYLVTSNRDGRASDGFPAGNDDRLLRIVPAE